MRRIAPIAPIASLVPLVPLMLVLSACDSQPEPAAPAASQAAPAAAMAGADMPQPGKYRVTMKVDAVNFPGMTGAMADKVKGMFGASGHTSEFCLTPEEARKGLQDFNKRSAQGDCTYEKFEAGRGSLDAVMVCKTGRGMTARSTVKGQYGPTGSTVTMATKTEASEMPGGGMAMEATVTSQRLGDCT